MVHIPTTERKYYDTQKKLSTLSAYAGALLPAAQNMQQMVKEQQDIKMDSLGVEARIKMNDATNEWRLANQSNPNNPEALKDLQSQYDSILSEYRGQIDPMYRSQWDIRGNKLKGAFDLENQTWGFKQRQENAKNDIAKSVDNFYKLAFSYGQSGDINKALADFQVSYDKLLDYGAKNLGTEDAAMLLKDYQANFYTSYLDGLVENNPSQALKMLNSKEFYGVLSQRDASRYKKYATARQKEINKEVYNREYDKFQKEPTKEGLDYLIKNNPKMGKKTKQDLIDFWEKSPNYEAVSTFEGNEVANQAILDLSVADFDNEDEAFNSLVDMTAKLQRTQIAGNLSPEDYYSRLAQLRAVYANEAIRKNIAQTRPTAMDYFNPFKLPAYSGASTRKTLKDIENKAMTDAMNLLISGGTVEDAKKIYHKAREDGIRFVNPELGNANVGDTILVKGRAVKIISFDGEKPVVSFVK